jgi:hypothetical protein
MMWGRGDSYEEVELKKGGDYGPSSVFRICSMNEMLDVKTSWLISSYGVIIMV